MGRGGDVSRYPRRWQEKRERSRTAQSAGRFTLVFSPFWRDPDVKTLTLDERDLLLCLRTGSLSNQTGIFLLNLDAIIRDFEAFGDRLATVGQPSREEMLTLLGALAKKPRPTRPFIMFDEDVVWICSHLAEERQEPSENHVKGIRFELSCLARHSKVVKAFRREYADLLGEGPGMGAGTGPTPGAIPSPHLTLYPHPLPSILKPHPQQRGEEVQEEGGVLPLVAPPQTPPVFKIFDLLRGKETATATSGKATHSSGRRRSTTSSAFSERATRSCRTRRVNAKRSACSKRSANASLARAGPTCSRPPCARCRATTERHRHAHDVGTSTLPWARFFRNSSVAGHRKREIALGSMKKTNNSGRDSRRGRGRPVESGPVHTASWRAKAEDVQERLNALRAAWVADDAIRPVWARFVALVGRLTAPWPEIIARRVAEVSDVHLLVSADGPVVPTSPSAGACAAAEAFVRELRSDVMADGRG